MFFKRKVKGATAKSRTCICGKPTCQKISKQFRELGDIRGDYAKLPNPQSLNEKDKFWIERFEVHHKTKNMEEHVFNNTKNDKKRTRQSAQIQLKKEGYVARWHYPDILIGKYKTDVPRLIKKQDAIKLKLLGDNQNTRTIYTNSDCKSFAKQPKKKRKKKAVKPDAEEWIALIPNVVDETYINRVLKELPRHIKIGKAEETALNTRTPPNRGRGSSVITSSSSNDSEEKQPHKKPKFAEELEKDDEQLMKFTKERLIKLAKQANDGFAASQQKWLIIDQEKQSLQQAIRKREREDTSEEDKAEIERQRKRIISLEDELTKLKKCGLNRFSMSNKDFFIENRRVCKDLYGFKDFEFLIGFIEDVLCVPYKTPKKPFVKGGTNGGNKLTEFEEVLLAMLYCNSNFNYDTIGSLFGVKSRMTVSDCISKWVPVLGETGDMLSTFTHWIDDEVLDKLKPAWYKKLGLDDIAAVIDGKDFICETVRGDRFLNTAQASNKVNHSAFRLLTWSLPCGTVIQRTPDFLDGGTD